jgi:hypothetical protein
MPLPDDVRAVLEGELVHGIAHALGTASLLPTLPPDMCLGGVEVALVWPADDTGWARKLRFGRQSEVWVTKVDVVNPQLRVAAFRDAVPSGAFADSIHPPPLILTHIS